MTAAQAKGFPEEACHLEYFSVPEVEQKPLWPFTLELTKSGKTVEVAEGEPATDALLRAGVHVDVKCSDGLCGVCKCTVADGAVDHRDFVLSKAQRNDQMILCQSRSEAPGGVLKIDL